MQQDSANTIYSEDCHDLRTLNFSLNKAGRLTAHLATENNNIEI